MAPFLRALVVIAIAPIALAAARPAVAAVDTKVKLPAPGNITVARFVVEATGGGAPKIVLANRAKLASTVAVVGAVRKQADSANRYEAYVVILRGCAQFAGSTEPAALTMAGAALLRPPGVQRWSNVATASGVRFAVPAIPASWISRIKLTAFTPAQIMRLVSLIGQGKRSDPGVVNLLRAMRCPAPSGPPAPPTPGLAPSFQLDAIALSYRINSTSDADICLSWATKPAQKNTSATITVSGPGGKVTAKAKTDAQGKASVKVNIKANFGQPLPIPVAVGLQMQSSSGPLVYSNTIDVGPRSTRPGTCTL